MSLNSDYSIAIVHNQRMKEFQAEAANDRLAKIAMGPRQPWWRRLFGAPALPLRDEATDWYRYPQVRQNGLKIGAHHVAR